MSQGGATLIPASTGGDESIFPAFFPSAYTFGLFCVIILFSFALPMRIVVFFGLASLGMNYMEMYYGQIALNCIMLLVSFSFQNYMMSRMEKAQYAQGGGHQHAHGGCGSCDRTSPPVPPPLEKPRDVDASSLSRMEHAQFVAMAGSRRSHTIAESGMV